MCRRDYIRPICQANQRQASQNKEDKATHGRTTNPDRNPRRERRIPEPSRPQAASGTDYRCTASDPPEHLTPELKALWIELTAQVLPGVAKYSDRIGFELLVKLTHKLRTDTLANTAEMTQLISLLGRFAMTPADRSKVEVVKPPKSALEKFRRPPANPPTFQVPTVPGPALPN